MVFFKRNFILSFINDLVIDHPTPINISYLWNFGSLAALALLVQIITGIFLAMHYVPNIDYAFLSIEHIMRDVNGGWLLRYLHANGASFFFIFVYLHIFRGFYYGAYYGANRETWFIGVTIYILMMATAFLGYVLPWGQMSFWGATVITNFFSVLPFIGTEIVEWLWGGFSVNNATLNRFYSLHFFLPFVILALVFLHLVALHNAQHTNPLGLVSFKQFKADLIAEVSFFPYFIVKDAVGVITFFLFLIITITFFPNVFNHPDNYIQANALSTPAHIVPEWYFLPFYAILRSIPNKILGVIAMFSSIFILYILPFIGSKAINTGLFKNFFKVTFWLFLVNCFILGWIGGSPVEYPFYEIGQVATCNYFIYFILIVPIFSVWGNIRSKKFYRRSSVYDRFVNNLKEDGSIVWPSIFNAFIERWKSKGWYKTVKWSIRHVFFVFAEIYRFFKHIGFNKILIKTEYNRFLKAQKNFDALAFSCYFEEDELYLRQLFNDSERFPGVYYAYKVLIIYEALETSIIKKLSYFYSLYLVNPYLIFLVFVAKRLYNFIKEIIKSDYYQIIAIISFVGFSVFPSLNPISFVSDIWFRIFVFIWVGIHSFFGLLTIVKDYLNNQKIAFIIMQFYIVIYTGFVWTYFF